MASVSILESKIKRLVSEINQLENKRSKALKDESDALKKINQATSAINRTKSSTTINNKRREIERENGKVQKAKEDQAKLLTTITKKNQELNKAQSDLAKERQKEQDKIYKKQEKQIQEFKNQQMFATEQIRQQPATSEQNSLKEYDVFISHSSDDKDDFVDQLAVALRKADIKVWYDSDNIGWGQSIRQEIDKGLTHSKYGIVIISPTFIEKYWTAYEVDGILQKESSTGAPMVLPIWHNVTADAVQKYSYSIANRSAMNTAVNTIDEIVENMKKIL